LIIHERKTVRKGSETVISSEIEWNNSYSSIPNTLWFSLPHQEEKHIIDRQDGFLASLILLAMHFGEDIEVRGEISPRLAYGLGEYQNAFNSWFPKRFTPINVKIDKLNHSSNLSSPQGVGAAFSGGVDSFHTLWSHLPTNQVDPYSQITHGLYVVGFDIGLDQPQKNQIIIDRYQKVFQQLDLKLLFLRTNLREFYNNQISWLYSHGCTLIGAALNFGKLFRRFYIPATYYYGFLVNIGTSPITDHLLSTEDTEIFHSGTSINRYEKIEIIRTWKVAQENLRVCANYYSRFPHLNCERCDKCYGTKFYLSATDHLEDFPVFKEKLNLMDIFRWLPVIGTSYTSIFRFSKKAFQNNKYLLSITLLLILPISHFLEKIRSSLPIKTKNSLIKKLINWKIVY
jgi:hypothetical protein